MNKKNFLWIGIGVILILMSFIVNAHTLNGDFSGIAFQGETIESAFVLCNTSDSSENFRINSDNSWMTLRPLSVYLNANSCGEFFAFTTPDPYAQSGNYEITITAQGNQSISGIFDLTVAEGHKINIQSNQSLINSTQCKEELFKFELTNTGIFDEKILLSVEGLNQNWIELSSEEILLPKNSMQELELKVLIPCNQETKNYDLKLKAELKNTGITKTKNISLNIENAQEILIQNKSFSSCNDLKTKDSISLTNTGLLTDELTLEIQGNNWISLNQTKISLNSNETKEIELNFNGIETEAKNYSFTLKVYSEKFNQLYEKEFNVLIEDCFDLSIESQSKETACIESNPEAVYILKNNGTKKMVFQLNLEGIKAELEKNSVSLNSNESIEVKAKLDFSESKTGETNFVFIADSENYSKSIENTILIQDCYNTETIVPELNLCKEIPSTNNITIKNTGTEKQVFSVSSTVEWINLKETDFELNSNEERIIELNALPKKDSTENRYSIKTKTENNQFIMNGKINYLNETECFGIEMTNLKNTIDVNAGEGAVTTIKVSNKGKTIQTVSFDLKELWVYFNPKEFSLNKGETKEIYVYFNPPFDFKEEQAVVIVKAKTNFGFETQKQVEVNVFGGSIVLTINPEDIKVNSKEVELKDTNENTIEIKIEIENNTETSMKILDVKTNFDSSYFIEEPVIKKDSTREILLKFTASEELELNGLEIPVEIISDKGTYYKIVKLPEKETKEDQEKTGETGFVLFGENDYVLVILVVIVVILIIMAALRTDEKSNKEEKGTVVDYSPEQDFQKELKEIITKKPQTRKKTSSKTKKKPTRKR